MTDTTGDVLEISTGAGVMPAHCWLPSSGSGPGILVLQEIFGVSEYIKRRSRELADLGYVVLAPNLYWRVGQGALDESAEGAMERAIAVRMRLDWQSTVDDAVAAFDALRAVPEVAGGVGVVGFCFGGGLAFNLAAVADMDAVVAYYGSDIPRLLDLAPRISAPALYHHGLADAFLTPDIVRKIENAVASQPGAEFRTYEGANHAFDNDRFAMYHAEASAAAWEATVSFLTKHLPVAPPAGA